MTSSMPYERVATLPTSPFRFIALDVETACGEMASICQIGIACVGNSNHIQTFSTFVDPETRFDTFNVELHGIGPDTVKNAPNFPAVWSMLLPLLVQSPLVQHSNFDKTAIAASCKGYGLPVPKLSWSDSIAVARKAWPEFKGNGGFGLGHLKKALAMEFKHHDAEEDARASAMVILHAERQLSKTFDQLARPLRHVQLAFPFMD